MKRVSVSDLKNRLSEYLRLVKRGQTVEILERNVPIARIEGISPDSRSASEYLEDLIRRGVLARPRGRIDLGFLSRPAAPCNADAVKSLTEDREDRV